MPHALSTTTTQSANVILVMKGIHSPIATEKQHCHQEWSQLIHAIHLLADPMQFAIGREVLALANVFLNILEIHMWRADQSVLFTLTAHPTKHARGTSVSTHALALAASMPSARCEATAQLAPASRTILEIPSQHVD
jgi:hypothetical protein